MDYAQSRNLVRADSRFDLLGNRLVLIVPRDSAVTSLPITGVDSSIDFLQVSYQRSLNLFGRTSSIQVSLPYSEGETEGFVEMRQGAGTFVRQVPERRRGEERSHQAVALARRMLEEAGRLRSPPGELRAALEKLLDGESA